MGLGGPVGGLITDVYVPAIASTPYVVLTILFSRLGWRWAFLMQIPLFAVSLGLVYCNLRYNTTASLIMYTLG